MLIGLLLSWGLKAAIDRRLEMTIPAAALPLSALLLLRIVQSVAFTGQDGDRMSLSMDVEATRQTLTIIFFLAFAFVAAANFLATRERLLWLANVLTVFGALLAAFALVQHFTWNGRIYWLRLSDQTVFVPFVNHNHFAGYMAMIVPMPLALMVQVVRGQARLLYGFAAALMGTAAIVSNSRSGVISLAASIVLMMILNKRSWRFLIAGVGLAMIAGVLWIGASGVVEHFGEAVDQLVHSGTPDVGRATIWQGTLSMIRAHPILGVGLGAYVTIYPTYENAPSLLRINYAHNDYLQILAEGGIVGGIIAVWFIAVILSRMYRGIASRNPLAAGMSLAAGAGIVAVLIQSLSDTDLQIPSNALLFLVLSAVVSCAGTFAQTQNSH